MAGALGYEDLPYLRYQWRCVALELQAQVKRQVTGSSEAWEHTGVLERRFAKARLTEQDGERLTLDQSRQFSGLRFTTVEEGSCVFGKR